MLRRSGNVGQILLHSLGARPLNGPGQNLDRLVQRADMARVPSEAASHGISGYVYHALKDCDVADPRVIDVLRDNYHQARLAHLRTLADLNLIGTAFDDLGIPWLVVKGPVLAEVIYDRPDLRSYTDLDLFVAPRWVGRAIDVLEELGGKVLDRNWDDLQRRMFSEVHISSARGTLVELHWHLLNEAAARKAFTVPMPELFDQPIRVPMPGGTVPTLKPVDTLVYLCMHASLSGADRLVWIKDIQHAAKAVATCWDRVAERSRVFGAGPIVAFMLDATRELMDVDVPPQIIRDLAGSTMWSELGRLVRQVWPPERPIGGPSPLRLMSRNLRPDGISTALAVSHRLLNARPRYRHSPTVSHSFGTFTTGSRQHYAAAVAATDRTPAGT